VKWKKASKLPPIFLESRVAAPGVEIGSSAGGEADGRRRGEVAAQVVEWTGTSRAWWTRRITREGRRAAAKSPEVGKDRHEEKGRLQLWRRGFVGCQTPGKIWPGAKNDEVRQPEDKWGIPGGFWAPKGALREMDPPPSKEMPEVERESEDGGVNR
jgi:hypothetical protein